MERHTPTQGETKMTAIKQHATYPINLAAMGLVSARILSREPVFTISLEAKCVSAAGERLVNQVRVKRGQGKHATMAHVTPKAPPLEIPVGTVSQVVADGTVIGHYDFDAKRFTPR
jgi:hypothetical protein